MEPELEWRMWRQLRGAFGINEFIFTPVVERMKGLTIRQADSMEEALAVLPSTTQRCFLEPTGYNPVSNLPDGDIALILGNTPKHNMEHAKVNETYHIATPAGSHKAHLYGTNAAAIALAVRWGQ